MREQHLETTSRLRQSGIPALVLPDLSVLMRSYSPVRRARHP